MCVSKCVRSVCKGGVSEDGRGCAVGCGVVVCYVERWVEWRTRTFQPMQRLQHAGVGEGSQP